MSETVLIQVIAIDQVFSDASPIIEPGEYKLKIFANPNNPNYIISLSTNNHEYYMKLNRKSFVALGTSIMSVL